MYKQLSVVIIPPFYNLLFILHRPPPHLLADVSVFVYLLLLQDVQQQVDPALAGQRAADHVSGCHAPYQTQGAPTTMLLTRYLHSLTRRVWFNNTNALYEMLAL